MARVRETHARPRPHAGIASLSLLIAGLLLLSPLTATPTSPTTPGVEALVGMEGVYYARHERTGLEAIPVDDKTSIVLRIADVTEEPGGTFLYEIRFIGTRPGQYDLRQWLRRIDERPIEGLESMPVLITGLLPEDHSGDLEELAASASARPWPYRLIAKILLIGWWIPVLWAIVVRMMRRKQTPPPVVIAAVPTLADQLRPLVASAVRGELSSTEQARLELLLIAHWRERLDLVGCSAGEAVRRLRDDDRAGVLLRQLEQWLHQPPGRAEVDVAALLAPYGDVPAVDAEEVSQ